MLKSLSQELQDVPKLGIVWRHSYNFTILRMSFKSTIPGIFFVCFCSIVQSMFGIKTVEISRNQTGIVKEEGELTDQFTFC